MSQDETNVASKILGIIYFEKYRHYIHDIHNIHALAYVAVNMKKRLFAIDFDLRCAQGAILTCCMPIRKLYWENGHMKLGRRLA